MHLIFLHGKSFWLLLLVELGKTAPAWKSEGLASHPGCMPKTSSSWFFPWDHTTCTPACHFVPGDGFIWVACFLWRPPRSSGWGSCFLLRNYWQQGDLPLKYLVYMEKGVKMECGGSRSWVFSHLIHMWPGRPLKSLCFSVHKMEIIMQITLIQGFLPGLFWELH